MEHSETPPQSIYQAILDRMIETTTTCLTCSKPHKSVKAQIQHLANTGCSAHITCYCGDVITSDDSKAHLASCEWLIPLRCIEGACYGIEYKTLESFSAHVWCAHGHSRKEIDPISYLIQASAQAATRFDHMQIKQLIDKTRDNTLRRLILKQLVLESNFAAANSKFLKLVRTYKMKNVPLFTKTDGCKAVSIRTADGIISVKINIRDHDYNAIVTRLQPLCVARAQALFGIDITHKMEGMEEMIGSCQDMLHGLGIFSQNIVQRIVAACCKFFVLIRTGFSDPTIIAATFLDMLMSLDVTSDIAMKAWEKVKEHVHVFVGFFSPAPRAQIGADAITSIATVLAVCFSTVITSRIPKDSEMASMLKSVDTVGRSVRGASFAFDGISKLVKNIVGEIFRSHFGVPTEISELEKYMSGVEKWFVEVQQLINFTTVDRLHKEPAMQTRVIELWRQGHTLSMSAAKLQVPRNVLQPFSIHLNTLKNYYDKATIATSYTGGAREEPLVIYLHGAAGVGKSFMMYALATDLLKIEGIPRDVNGKPDLTQEVYSRMTETEYWDAYAGQRIVLYDDFLQQKDSETNPNKEIMEIIRMANLVKYPLHMAHLSDKGATNFISKVVICTSNTPIHTYNPKSIECAAALRRRIDVYAEVSVKDEFTERRAGNDVLSKEKVMEVFNTPHSLEIYKITLKNAISGHTLRWKGKEVLSYEDFSAYCRLRYQHKHQQAVDLQEFLVDRALKEPTDATSYPRAQIGVPLFDTVKNMLFRPYIHVDPEDLADVDETMSSVVLQDHHQLRKADQSQIELIPAELLIQIMAPALVTQLWLEGPLEQKTPWSDIVRRHIEETNMPVWREDAADILLRITKDDLALRMLMAPLVREIVPRETPKVVVKLRKLASEFKTQSSIWFEKAKEILAKHPLLIASTVFVPLILYAMYQWFRKEPSQPKLTRKVNDLLHSQLTSKKRLLHAHSCTRCKKVFSHAHAIGTIWQSLSDPPLCGTCSDQWSAQYDHDKGEISFVPTKDNIVSEAEAPKKLVECFTEKELEDLTQSRLREFIELTTSGDPKTRRRTLRVQLASPTVEDPNCEFNGVEAQFRSDEGAADVSQKILGNIYKIAVGDGTTYTAALKILMIGGRVGLTVAHLKPYLARNSHVRLTSLSVPDGITFTTKELKCHVIEGSDGQPKDQMLIEFPKRAVNHCSIDKHFATSHDMSFNKIPIVLVNPNTDGTVLLKYGIATAHDKPLTYADDDMRPIKIRSFYKYELETAAGDCGSIVVGIGPSIQHKILGVHVAGGVGTGYASPLNRADIARTLKTISPEAQIQLDLDPVLKRAETSINLPQGNFIKVGVPIFQVARPATTKLRESAVYGQITTPTTAPSALRPILVGDERVDPLMKGLKKAGSIPPPLDAQILDACVNDVARILTDNIDPNHQRVLTNMEAVAGIELDPNAPGITRTTSAGFPLAREARGKGKQPWLGIDDYLLPEEVEEMMIEIEDNARQGKRTPTIWTDTLKDERRPLAKVQEGKTRVFSAGPMCYTLVFRKYFLGFAAHCARNRVTNEIAVGTNPRSMDWHDIAERVQSKGKKVIAGDFSNFDGTLVSEILWATLDIINRFYDDGPENAFIREVLWTEIVNSVHVFDNSVYIWTHSQPSGCPLTAIINSIYNSLSMRYVWMITVPVEYQNMKSFNEHVAMISYGDDNLVNIAEALIKYFNQITIARGYTTLGMTYTDEAKSGELVEHRSIEEVSFLKRTFLRDGTASYRAPLALDTILEMVNWVRGDLDNEEKTRENMETAAEELSLHPDCVFNEWISKFKTAGATMSTQPQLLTLFEYRHSMAIARQGIQQMF